MKKYLLFATAFVALASCSDDTFVGENSSPNGVETGTQAIVFNSGAKAITRADKTGADAAALLGNKFYVTGVKGDGTGTSQSDVFKTYSVEWVTNTAGKTASNTSDWEYVGKTHDFTYSPAISSQTIKYWDYSTTAYDFCAYSIGNGNALVTTTPSTNQILGSKIDYSTATTGAYTIQGNRDELSKCYITDMKTVAKADYGKEVQLQFRSLASKVRIALYETVPGYSVRDVVFYTDNTKDLTATCLDSSDPSYATLQHNEDATLFGTDAFYTAGTYTVSFPHIGSSYAAGGSDATAYAPNAHPDYNKAHVTFVKTDDADTQGFGTLRYVAGEGSLSSEDKYLGRTSANASFAGTTSPYYVTVLPNETGVVLEMRVNYTLVGNDGGGEKITVHGAKAYVPLQYTKWMPNYAYTYIFKISDNTDGWTSTSTTDPAGLYPITFDAVVLDPILATTEQTTITTVAMPSITTYQKGHLYTDGDEYTVAKGDIYVQVMKESTLATDLGSNGKLYAITGTSPISEATVMDALAIQESSNVGRNGLTLTDATTTASVSATITSIPGMDGNNITVDAGTAAKFSPVAGTTYAYVYDTQTWNGVKVHLTTTPTDFESAYYINKGCTTLCTGTVPAAGDDYYQKQGYIYTANQTDTKPSDWDTAGVWYQDPDGKTPVTSWVDGNAGKTFYKKYSVDGKIYAVKVIKIVA